MWRPGVYRAFTHWVDRVSSLLDSFAPVMWRPGVYRAFTHWGVRVVPIRCWRCFIRRVVTGTWNHSPHA